MSNQTQKLPSEKLIFGRGNAKLEKSIITFSLPSGWTCPGAKLCLAKADRLTGKIRDGRHQSFRCFSATSEAAFPTVRKARWHNFETLQKCPENRLHELILRDLPAKARLVRIHVGGDFFSQAYFDAWLKVATAKPDIIFYAYTKSLSFLVKHNQLPTNLRIIASEGGKFDWLIQQHKIKSAKVVFSPEEAKSANLKIDHDDSLAYGIEEENFALLIHGTQPKNSDAASAIKTLRVREIKFAY